MARDKKVYKAPRKAKGEGPARFCTVNLNEKIAGEFKLLIKAYSEVYGQKMTPTQVIKRLIDAGVKRCDPEVYAVFCKLLEEGIAPEPVLEITHPVDPTEGEVWEMKYFFEKDGEQLAAEWAKSERASFSVKINNRSCGVKEMLKNGWILMNDAGIEINEEQAMEIAQKRRKHLKDVEFQTLIERGREQARRYNEELEEVPAFDYKYKLEKDGEIKEVFSYEMDEYCDAGWTLHTSNLKSSEDEK